MNSINPSKSIVPILIVSEYDPVKKFLGTGAFIGSKRDFYILTAKHIFEGHNLKDDEKFGFSLNEGSGMSIWAIKQIVASEDYDIVICSIEYVKNMVPLQFAKQQPSLNADVFCYEYSRTRIEKISGGKNVVFQPFAHKGNIMRYFESDYPEKTKTSCFNTSFPALRGASGAPVLSSTANKISILPV